MLDVHPPHAPTHTWRDFFIHIATIVVGLLIAVGLEQTVEFFHHRHQAHRLELALDQEVERNRVGLEREIAILDEVIATEESNKAGLLRTQSTNGKEPYIYQAFDPLPNWMLLTDATWAEARDSGALALLPIERAQYIARIDVAIQTANELAHQIFDAEYRMLAYAHLRPNPAELTASERDAMLVTVSQYEEVARHAGMVFRRTLGTFDQKR